MVDLVLVHHIIESLEEYIKHLEEAWKKGNVEKENMIKTRIYSLSEELDRLTKI